MRRIRRPATRLIKHLAHYHIGVRGVIKVKHCGHNSVTRTVPLSFAEFLIKAIIGVIKNRFPFSVVIRHLNKHFAVGKGSYFCVRAMRKMHGIRLFLKRIFTLAILVNTAAYRKINFSRQQKDCTLVILFINNEFFAFFQFLNINIHKHFGIYAVHLAQNLFSVFVKLGFEKHICHLLNKSSKNQSVENSQILKTDIHNFRRMGKRSA